MREESFHVQVVCEDKDIHNHTNAHIFCLLILTLHVCLYVWFIGSDHLQTTSVCDYDVQKDGRRGERERIGHEA